MSANQGLFVYISEVRKVAFPSVLVIGADIGRYCNLYFAVV